MTSFEKEYYEKENFWEGEMVQDAGNLERIRRTIEAIPKDVRSIADVGCGNGVFVNHLSEIRPDLKIIGVDRSKMALSFVKVDKVEADIDSLPFPNESFDCATCLEVLEHLPVPIYKPALQELARISSKYLIISVPFSEIIEDSYTKCPGCKSIFNYQMHLRRYEENDMRNLLAPYGFECTSVQKLGRFENYMGHRLYTKIVAPSQVLAWRSPICPICGYAKADSEAGGKFEHTSNSGTAPKKSIFSQLLAPVKALWPKERKYYWIVAVYEKRKS